MALIRRPRRLAAAVVSRDAGPARLGNLWQSGNAKRALQQPAPYPGNAPALPNYGQQPPYPQSNPNYGYPNAGPQNPYGGAGGRLHIARSRYSHYNHGRIPIRNSPRIRNLTARRRRRSTRRAMASRASRTSRPATQIRATRSMATSRRVFPSQPPAQTAPIWGAQIRRPTAGCARNFLSEETLGDQ